MPGVLSQHGCMGDSLRGLLDELATAGSQSLAVQLIFNCASAGEARGSLLSFWKRSLSVVHARAKGTRIAHFYQHVEHVPPAGSAHSAPLPHRSEFTPSSRALPAPSAWPDRGDFALPFSHNRAHFARALERTSLPVTLETPHPHEPRKYLRPYLESGLRGRRVAPPAGRETLEGRDRCRRAPSLEAATY